MNRELLRQIDKEIDYMAHEIVVPISGVATTPYEIGAIKKYKAELALFANRIYTLIMKAKEEKY